MKIPSAASVLIIVSIGIGCAVGQTPPTSTGNTPGSPPISASSGGNGKAADTAPADVVARSPSIELAEIAAKTIVASCKGYHVGVAILDAAGTPKLYYIPDGTAGTHAFTAYRKANTALAFKMPSEKASALAKTDPAVAARFNANADNYIGWAGGIPILVNNEVIGAIGVSGAEPSAKDEACAVDGLNKIQNRLR